MKLGICHFSRTRRCVVIFLPRKWKRFADC